jgi:hypothetical protein
VTADIGALLGPIRTLHERIRDAVVDACGRLPAADLARVDREADSDTIYRLDLAAELDLVESVERDIASICPVALVAEGLPGGEIALPRGTDPSRAGWKVILDPIDGTRSLMYQKRSAWVLTGVARNRGPDTTMADLELAVQTEIPTAKQHLADVLWAVRGRGATAERVNRVSGARQPLGLRPSTERTIAHGYAMVARFFPGARDELAAIDEEIVQGALGPGSAGRAICFEDQYPSTGGQLYELAAGHDRFVADLRPLLAPVLQARGLPPPLCCHPYDLCTELIARELGVIVCDPSGAPLFARLSVDADVAWAGYANREIHASIEPLMQAALRRRGLLGR